MSENTSFYLLLAILVFEFFIFIILFVALVIRKFWNTYTDKKNKYEKQIISRIIQECLQKKNSIEKIKKYAFTQNLLLVLEDYEKRFKGEEWDELKYQISVPYLLPKARKWKKKYSWIKRNLAARCFALTPLFEDLDSILKLIDDPIFLVQSFAVIAAMHIKTKESISKIIHMMSKRYGFSLYFYLDTFQINENEQVFKWIEEIAEQEKDTAIRLTCLELLATKTIKIKSNFLSEDLHSNDINIRKAAVKVYALNPQKDSKEVLMSVINDPNEEIRSLAVKGLGNFLSKEVIENLEEVLNKDSSPLVRIEAASSLKKFGKLGLDILSKTKDKEAREAAQYVLTFDE